MLTFHWNPLQIQGIRLRVQAPDPPLKTGQKESKVVLATTQKDAHKYEIIMIEI